MAYGALGPQPHQIGNQAYFRGGPAGAAQIASYGAGQRNFVAPITGTYFFAVSGASGAGLTSANNTNALPGGGGHGYTEVPVKLQKGDTISINAGFGGRNISNGGGTNIDIPGTTTTVSGPGLSLSVTSGANGSGITGGAGGVGSGGTLNLTGGAGGDTPTGNALSGASGGGTVPGAGGAGTISGSFRSGGGGGGAGTAAHPGNNGGPGLTAPSTASAGGGSGGVNANSQVVGSFGGDARVSVYWLG